MRCLCLYFGKLIISKIRSDNCMPEFYFRIIWYLATKVDPALTS